MFNSGLLFAQTASNSIRLGQAANPGPLGGMSSILLIVGMFVIIYLVLFLPERNRQKKLKQQISQIKQGDRILTNSGIYGTVDFISEKSIYIKSLESKLEVAKESIAAILKNQ
jgi:preprotein translocase subunit YajC